MARRGNLETTWHETAAKSSESESGVAAMPKSMAAAKAQQSAALKAAWRHQMAPLMAGGAGGGK